MKNPNDRHDELLLRPADDLLIIELDDRLEMGVAPVGTDTNYGCNASSCTQNGYCPKK